MSTYLVTGGAGFIGSHIVDRLLGMGHTVVVIDNFDPLYSPLYKESNILPHHHHPHFILHRKDIMDKEALDVLFDHNDFDAIIHMAARPGVRQSFQEPEHYRRANVEGTRALFEATHAHGDIPVVYASSSTVYGNQGVPFVEDLPFELPALSPYGETKRETERIAAEFAAQGVPSIGLRFFSIYGERNRPDLAAYRFLDALFHDRPLTVLGDGTYQRDLTYVSDAVDSVLAALEAVPHVEHEVVNIGNDRPVSMNDLIVQLEALAGRKAQRQVEPPHRGDAKINQADIAKARRLLKWQPQVALSEGLERLVRWFRRERLN